jgi:hypothetical protein
MDIAKMKFPPPISDDGYEGEANPHNMHPPYLVSAWVLDKACYTSQQFADAQAQDNGRDRADMAKEITC